MGGRFLLSPETLPVPHIWAGPASSGASLPGPCCYPAKGKAHPEQEFTLLRRLGEVRAAREAAEEF